MRKNILKFILAMALLTAVFMAFFYLELYLESKHLVDSVGLWYTILCAFVYTLVTAIILGALYLFVRWLVTAASKRKQHA